MRLSDVSFVSAAPMVQGLHLQDVFASLRLPPEPAHEEEPSVPQTTAQVLRREALLRDLDILDDRIDAAERMGGVPDDLLTEREALIARLEGSRVVAL